MALRSFGPGQIHARYIAWLNDPTVNAYSQRRDGPPIGETDARRYLAELRPDEVVFSVNDQSDRHVGNVKYGPIDWAHRRADISILIGERSVWGRGTGAEAVYLLCRFLFEDVGLNRVDAGTRNPAFVRLVQKIGWRVEGVLRNRIRATDGFHDQILVAQLADEFVRRAQYEPVSK